MLQKCINESIFFLFFFAPCLCSCGGSESAEPNQKQSNGSLVHLDSSSSIVTSLSMEDELEIHFQKAGGKKHFVVEVVSESDYQKRDPSKFWLSSSKFLPSSFTGSIFSSMYPLKTAEGFPSTKLLINAVELPSSDSEKYFVRLHYFDLSETEKSDVMDEKNGVDRFASLIGKAVDAKVSDTYYLRVKTPGKTANVRIVSGDFIPLTLTQSTTNSETAENNEQELLATDVVEKKKDLSSYFASDISIEFFFPKSIKVFSKKKPGKYGRLLNERTRYILVDERNPDRNISVQVLPGMSNSDLAQLKGHLGGDIREATFGSTSSKNGLLMTATEKGTKSLQMFFVHKGNGFTITLGAEKVNFAKAKESFFDVFTSNLTFK